VEHLDPELEGDLQGADPLDRESAGRVAPQPRPGAAFEVTAAAPEISLDPARRGTASWTIRNLTGRRLRVRATPRPDAGAASDWLRLDGEPEWTFEVGASQTIAVAVAVPAEAVPGRYAVRLDVAAADNPDDEWAAGPPVVFAVPEPEARPQSFPWRWLAVGGGALALLGIVVLAWWLLAGGPDLTVVGVSTSPAAPRQGDAVQVEVEIANEGSGGAGPFTVTWQESASGARTTFYVNGLAGNEVRALSVPWHPVEGTYAWSATIDPDDRVDEADEENNTSAGQVVVGPVQP
jgi:hypothetical protein